MSAVSLYEKMQEELAKCKEDIIKFEHGNAVAGRRVRLALQKVRSAAFALRQDIQLTINARKEK